MFKALSIPLQISLGTVFCLSASPIVAQVTTDGTVNTQVNQDGNVSEITGGETRGDNLFHSFQDFSVQTGNEAFFNNADSISNIFSRVTGGNISNIDGLIRANGSASLFLINPAGIVFGENARLDIGGSFYGSSASSILFEDGEFSATDLDNPPLLTINAPIGLNLRDEPGDITVRGDGNGARLEDSEVIDTQDALRVGSNATIGLLGGNVSFEDATVKTAGGRIEIGSVAEGTVNLIAVDNGFTFDYSGIEAFQDITLSGITSIDASGLGGGDIQAAGNNISLTEVSDLISFTLGSTPGKDINIFAAESLNISGVENELNFVSAISTRAFPNSTADAGNINIETGSLTIGDRGLISSSTSGQGNAGNIDLNAGDSITLASQGNTSAIFSGVNTGAVGNGGNVNLATGSFSASNGGFINSSTSGQGNAGNIDINASDSITLASQGNTSAIFSGVNTGAVGNGGNVNLATNSLTLSNGGFINSSTSGQGNAGNIDINANDSITLESQENISAIFSGVSADAVGDGGNVDMTTGSFTASDGAFVSVNTSGQGNAGNIAIDSDSLSLTNGSSFSANTRDRGNAGNISIDAADIAIDGQGNSEDSTGLFSNVSSDAVGDGGNVDLVAESIDISNGGAIDLRSFGQGNGGNVTIDATDSIVIENSDPSSSNNNTINTSVSGENARGSAGDIDITTNSLSFDNETQLLAINFANGQGGDVTINAMEDVSFSNNSQVFVSGAPGGFINISAKNLFIFSGSDLFAGITGETSSLEAQTGDIIISLEEDLVLDGLQSDNTTSIANSSFGTGDPGDIEIGARNITFQNGGSIASNVTEQQAARIGNITLNATGDIVFDGVSESAISGIFNLIPENLSGSIGDVNVEAQNLTIANGAAISSFVGGTGDSGNINIDAANSITIDGFSELTTDEGTTVLPSGILSNITPNATGNAGTININTQNLNLSRNGSIEAIVGGRGNGGDINLNAEQITISERGNPDIIPSSIRAETLVDAEGNGGNITVNSRNFSISDEGVLNTSSLGQGNAGNITIDATNNFSLDNDSLVTSNIGNPGDSAIGRVGNISISARNIALNNSSQIQAGAFAGGTVEETGTVSLIATESISFTAENTGIFSNNDAGSFGNASDTQLSASEIIFRDGAVIEAFNSGEGNGGNVAIDANNLSLENGSTISSGTRAGSGGNITFNIADDIVLQDNSEISASAIEDANGGNLTIDSRFIIAFPDGNNDITASAEQGRGGNISINAEALFGIQEGTLSDLTNDINASSQVSGLDGTIDITNPNIDLIQGATELPTSVVVPEQTTQQACQSNREAEAKNGLNIVGKGGVPPAPELPLSSLNPVESDTSTSDIPAPIETSQGKIQPARGIKVSETGEISLVAYRTNNAGDRLPEIKQNCDRI